MEIMAPLQPTPTDPIQAAHAFLEAIAGGPVDVQADPLTGGPELRNWGSAAEARLHHGCCPHCLAAIGPLPAAGEVGGQRAHGCRNCGWSYAAYLRSRRLRQPGPDVPNALTLDLECTLTWLGVSALAGGWLLGLVLIVGQFLHGGG